MSQFEPNTQRRADLITLRNYVRGLSDGARLSWVEIEQATSVLTATGSAKFTNLARNLFREACHRESRTYLPLPGGGVEMSSHENAGECVDRYTKRAFGAIESAATKVGRVVSRHVGELPSERAKELSHKAGVIAMLQMVAKSKRKEVAAPALPPRTTGEEAE